MRITSEVITLKRQITESAGTIGNMELEERTYWTMEQPDLGNKPYESCVPLGEYDLIPFLSPRYGDCYIMVNEDLNVYEFENSLGRPGDGRFLCLFVHKGNYVRNFRGCVGAGRHYLEDKDMITSTKTTCVEVNRAVVKEGSYELYIQHEVE